MREQRASFRAFRIKDYRVFLDEVIFLGVFLNHAVCIVFIRQSSQIAADAFDPEFRNTLSIAVEEFRNYLLSERTEEI